MSTRALLAMGHGQPLTSAPWTQRLGGPARACSAGPGCKDGSWPCLCPRWALTVSYLTPQDTMLPLSAVPAPVLKGRRTGHVGRGPGSHHAGPWSRQRRCKLHQGLRIQGRCSALGPQRPAFPVGLSEGPLPLPTQQLTHLSAFPACPEPLVFLCWSSTPHAPPQVSPAHSLRVTPASCQSSALGGIGLAGLLPVWDSPPLPGLLIGCGPPSLSWASLSTPFPHSRLVHALCCPGRLTRQPVVIGQLRMADWLG